MKVLVRYLPFLLTFLLFLLRIIIQYIIKYRSVDISTNLHKAFDNLKSKAEMEEIQAKYYHVLIRYIKEVFFKVGWKRDRMLKSVIIEDRAEWINFFENEKSTVVLTSHSGNWELNLPLLPSLVPYKVVAFYKPISNQFIDNLMLTLRSDYGLENYPIEQTVRVMNRLKDEKCLYLFVGDQSPLNMNGVYWNKFLQQDTPWLIGGEKLAKRYKLPVVYLEQIPIEQPDNVLYKLKFHLISTQSQNTMQGEITENYARLLENEITSRPEYWLWSHRRWKRSHLKDDNVIL